MMGLCQYFRYVLSLHSRKIKKRETNLAKKMRFKILSVLYEYISFGKTEYG